MTTPAGTTIQAHTPDGERHDVTEAVQALYDLLIGSLDWGSGFLSIEEVEPLAQLARLCGFAHLDAAESYIREAREEAERKAAWMRKYAPNG